MQTSWKLEYCYKRDIQILQEEIVCRNDAIVSNNGDVTETNSKCTFEPETSTLLDVSSVHTMEKDSVVVQDQTRCDNETLQTQSTLSPVTELNTDHNSSSRGD